ncbi:MAG: glycoside hydrolase family 16 protein [Spirochaetia bacterium]|nr:glycoside hydrolase family 16 protein [Spirochaetia bacterium]
MRFFQIVLSLFVFVFFALSCVKTPRPQLTFEENFDGAAFDASRWEAQNAASGHILSSRWAENNVVSNGELRQVTRKEDRGGKHWTSAHLFSKFSQRYGRFECRYKYGGGTGLNNAFWLTVKDQGDPKAFNQVVDINKGRYTNQVYIHLHRKPGAQGKDFEKIFEVPGADFSRDFHVFAVEWRPSGLVFEIDGKEVARILPEEGADELTGTAVVHVSTAVMAEAGPVTDDLNGRAMVVDWIRVSK